jgi:hypothetical protein
MENIAFRTIKCLGVSLCVRRLDQFLRQDDFHRARGDRFKPDHAALVNCRLDRGRRSVSRAHDRPPKAAVRQFKADNRIVEVDRIQHLIGRIVAYRKNDQTIL